MDNVNQAAQPSSVNAAAVMQPSLKTLQEDINNIALPEGQHVPHQDVQQVLTAAETQLKANSPLQETASASHTASLHKEDAKSHDRHTDDKRPAPTPLMNQLHDLTGLNIQHEFSTMTADRPDRAPSPMLVFDIPVSQEAAASVEMLAVEERNIKAKLSRIPSLGTMLAEPLGRQLDELVQSTPASDKTHGFDADERKALAGWKHTSPTQLLPAGTDVYGVVFKVDDCDKEKVIENLNGRSSAIALQMAQYVAEYVTEPELKTLKEHLAIAAQPIPEGVALVVNLQGQPQQEQSPPLLVKLMQQQAPDGKSFAEKIAVHSALYAGSGWANTFAALSPPEEKRSYLEYIKQQKSPELQEKINAVEKADFKHASQGHARIEFPQPEHGHSFRVQLVPPQGQTLKELYDGIAQAAATHSHNNHHQTAAATPDESKLAIQHAETSMGAQTRIQPGMPSPLVNEQQAVAAR